MAGRAQARELVLLGGRLVGHRRIAVAPLFDLFGPELLLRRRGLGFGFGQLFFAGGDVGFLLRYFGAQFRLLRLGLRLLVVRFRAGEPVLAGPAFVCHSCRSGSSKRRSWWCSLWASLFRLAAR